MKKKFAKILLLIFSLLITACSNNSSESDSSIFSSDQTQEAFDSVAEANEKLKKIKTLFNENEQRQDDLKKALKAQDATKVKEIANELINQINLGIGMGNEAIAKIESVQGMNVNADFKSYLGLKTNSLRKYIEAYEERRELATLLRNNYDPKNEDQRKRVTEEFKKGDENFKKILEEAQQTSDRANDLAREALSKKQEN